MKCYGSTATPICLWLSSSLKLKIVTTSLTQKKLTRAALVHSAHLCGQRWDVGRSAYLLGRGRWDYYPRARIFFLSTWHRQWCAGASSTAGQQEPWLVVSAGSRGVNASTMADFRLTRRCRQPRTGKIHSTGFPSQSELAPAPQQDMQVSYVPSAHVCWCEL